MHKLAFICLVVSEHLLLLGVVSLGLALLQIFGVILTSCLFARYIEGYYCGFPENFEYQASPPVAQLGGRGGGGSFLPFILWLRTSI